MLALRDKKQKIQINNSLPQLLTMILEHLTSSPSSSSQTSTLSNDELFILTTLQTFHTLLDIYLLPISSVTAATVAATEGRVSNIYDYDYVIRFLEILFFFEYRTSQLFLQAKYSNFTKDIHSVFYFKIIK